MLTTARHAALVAGLLVLPAGAVSANAEGSLQVRGLVRADNEALISSEVNARVVKMPYREGEAFAKGDLLVEFDCRLLRADLNEARASLSAARKKHLNNKQLADLNAIGNVDVQVSEANEKEAAARLRGAGIRAKKCTIHAPYAGRVVERFAHRHESVASEQKLLRIIDTSALYVELILPSKWLVWLSPGTTFKFHVDETQVLYAGEVTRVSPVVDSVSHTVRAYGRLSDGDAKVLAGMSGSASFSDKHTASAR
ncbi:MAG: efflux RND transporter periplasmic adaptor subunit [Pseudomonadota bacterium]